LPSATRFDELRVTHAQNIVLPYVRRRSLYALWQALEANGLGERQPRSGDATSSPAPASIIAALANARSIPVAQKIAQRLRIEPRMPRSAS
jgi:sulfite reductase (NADPH) hemoprotein beta-component